jgi:hypothetical protein
MISNTRIKPQRTAEDEAAVARFLAKGGTVYSARIGESASSCNVPEFRKYRERGLRKLQPEACTYKDSQPDSEAPDNDD